jgi:hypothetical protein
MGRTRLLMHPVLLQRRSRAVLFWYFVAVGLTGGLLWWKICAITRSAGIDLRWWTPTEPPPLLSALLSPYVQIALVFISVIIGGTLTSISIVGPFKRIEEWLVDWEVGHEIKPLQARSGDRYEHLIHLINDLHERAKKGPGKPEGKP